MLQLSCRSVIPTCRSLPAAQPPPEPQAPCASCARPAGYVPCSLPGCFSRAPVRSLPPASGALAGVAAPKHRGVLFHAAHRAISLVTDFPKSPPVTSSPGKRWPAPMGRGGPLLRSPGAAVGRGHRCSPELLPRHRRSGAPGLDPSGIRRTRCFSGCRDLSRLPVGCSSVTPR